MQDTKQKILTLLKMNGGLTTGGLSTMLGISATAVRRHLGALATQGLVARRTAQQGMGRPSFIYDLTAGASRAFPQSYAAFATRILQDLAELDGLEKLNQLFRRHCERRRQQYRSQVGGETLSDRVASLARLLEDEGRMTTWEQFGERQFILREHNCPILRIAEIFDQPCQCEIDLFRELLQARIERVNHIPDGDIACVYEIEAQNNYHTAEQSSDCSEVERPSKHKPRPPRNPFVMK